MTATDVPDYIIFSGFMVVSGLVACWCWIVLRKNWKRLRKNDLPRSERWQAKFNIFVSFFPFLAFACEFVFFAAKFLQSLF